MPRLLVVHHSPSPATYACLDAVLAGARDPEAGEVEVVVRPALVCAGVEALEADGYLLGTPANIGTMSGALKHFFDSAYYLCLDATAGRPYGLWVHGNDDTTGAVRAVERIATALRWRAAAAPVAVIGAPQAADVAALRDLGGVLAVSVAEGY